MLTQFFQNAGCAGFSLSRSHKCCIITSLSLLQQKAYAGELSIGDTSELHHNRLQSVRVTLKDVCKESEVYGCVEEGEKRRGGGV